MGCKRLRRTRSALRCIAVAPATPPSRAWIAPSSLAFASILTPHTDSKDKKPPPPNRKRTSPAPRAAHEREPEAGADVRPTQDPHRLFPARGGRPGNASLLLWSSFARTCCGIHRPPTNDASDEASPDRVPLVRPRNGSRSRGVPVLRLRVPAAPKRRIGSGVGVRLAALAPGALGAVQAPVRAGGSEGLPMGSCLAAGGPHQRVANQRLRARRRFYVRQGEGRTSERSNRRGALGPGAATGYAALSSS